MLSYSTFTSIIGFLTGFIFYLTVESTITFLFLFGGVGYFIGMFFDNKEYKDQLGKFDLATMPTSYKIFHPAELPESTIVYSPHDNITTAFLALKVERKPENYRLSVLKNLHEYDFRIIEDSSQTIFSLCIEYPEFNYSSIKHSEIQNGKFLYDIKEHSLDFQGALRKIIPGLVLSISPHPNIFNQNDSSNYLHDTPSPPFHLDRSHDTNQDFISIEPELYDFGDEEESIDKKKETNSINEISKITVENTKTTRITEDQIFQDLDGKEKSSSVRKEIPELKLLANTEDSSTSQDINDEADELNLEEAPNSTDIKMDYSAINESNIDQRESIPPDPLRHKLLEKLKDATTRAEELLEKAENKALFVIKGDIEQES